VLAGSPSRPTLRRRGGLAADGDRASGLVVVAGGDDGLAVRNDPTVVEEHVDMVGGREQRADIALTHEVGLHPALDGLLDRRIGAVDELADAVADPLLPPRQRVDVGVDARVLRVGHEPTVGDAMRSHLAPSAAQGAARREEPLTTLGRRATPTTSHWGSPASSWRSRAITNAPITPTDARPPTTAVATDAPLRGRRRRALARGGERLRSSEALGLLAIADERPGLHRMPTSARGATLARALRTRR
jgi:hypothetical protein